MGACVKNHSWTKNAGNFMKLINPLKKIFFHCLAHLDLENFLIKVWGGGGGMCEKSQLNQKCRKFHEIDKSTKKNFFSLFGPFGLRKFSRQSLRWFEGHIISNVFQTFSIRLNFIRWSKWGMTTITNYKSQHLASYLCHIISKVLQTFTIRLNFIRQSKWRVTTLH